MGIKSIRMAVYLIPFFLTLGFIAAVSPMVAAFIVALIGWLAIVRFWIIMVAYAWADWGQLSGKTKFWYVFSICMLLLSLIISAIAGTTFFATVTI